jgi:hypothetical protein
MSRENRVDEVNRFLSGVQIVGWTGAENCVLGKTSTAGGRTAPAVGKGQ